MNRRFAPRRGGDNAASPTTMDQKEFDDGIAFQQKNYPQEPKFTFIKRTPCYFSSMASNVLGGDLQPCSLNPVTGFYRNGTCDTCADDKGKHTVCAVMTDEFLEFSAQAGNDLSTPVPEYQFPGLKAGDRWCVCMGRWIEALNADMAPKIVLESCHISVTEFVDIEVLKKYAVKEES